VPRPSSASVAWLNPAVLFAVLSAVLGTLLIAVTPPLRGPDETAHFVRAYGLSQGIIIPGERDIEGRKGIQMPADLFRGFNFFEQVRISEKDSGFGYEQAFAKYFSPAGMPALTERHAPAVFVPYEGSEGYSPVAYLPHAIAAFAARLAGLDFLPTIYLMRFAGLAAMTAVVAYAIALAGPLGWSFMAIALLPAAIYGRAVINADGAAVAFAMVAVALCLRAARDLNLLQRCAWLCLCVLGKPPNLAFVALEILRHPLRELRRNWIAVALVVAPPVLLAVLWTLASSADVAAWRLVELHGENLEEFDPAWKLNFMLNNPWHLPQSFLGMLQAKDAGEFWRQVIGVLGLFDTVLARWVYPVVTALLLATFFVRLDADRRERHRLARAALASALFYCLAVLLIFYLIWTPVHDTAIRGVQGRYFVPILPLLAIATAALINRQPDRRLTALCAVAAGALSGVASVVAILHADWNLF
jgi:uncharacterized membrane protein